MTGFTWEGWGAGLTRWTRREGEICCVFSFFTECWLVCCSRCVMMSRPTFTIVRLPWSYADVLYKAYLDINNYPIWECLSIVIKLIMLKFQYLVTKWSHFFPHFLGCDWISWEYWRARLDWTSSMFLYFSCTFFRRDVIFNLITLKIRLSKNVQWTE